MKNVGKLGLTVSREAFESVGTVYSPNKNSCYSRINIIKYTQFRAITHVAITRDYPEGLRILLKQIPLG
jgi:hypothetical protein